MSVDKLDSAIMKNKIVTKDTSVDEDSDVMNDAMMVIWYYLNLLFRSNNILRYFAMLVIIGFMLHVMVSMYNNLEQ